jgi:hypothetical protein
MRMMAEPAVTSSSTIPLQPRKQCETKKCRPCSGLDHCSRGEIGADESLIILISAKWSQDRIDNDQSR